VLGGLADPVSLDQHPLLRAGDDRGHDRLLGL
jgi:hypothetical protein